MVLKYMCGACENKVVLSQYHLDISGYKEGDPIPDMNCRCTHPLIHVLDFPE